MALDRAAAEPTIPGLDALMAATGKGSQHVEGGCQTNTDEYRVLQSAERLAAARS